MNESPISELLSRWDEMSSGYLPGRGRLIESLVEVVRARPSPTVLDLGCGPGTLLAHLGASIPGITLVGIDNDPVLLELARSQAATGGSAITLIDAPLDSAWSDRPEFASGVDVVVAMLVLHYFAEDQWPALFDQARRVLRPGGCLAIIDVTDPVTNPERQTMTLDWRSWWAMAEASDHPALRQRFAERRARPATTSSEATPNLAAIARVAAESGFLSFAIRLAVGPSVLATAHIPRLS